MTQKVTFLGLVPIPLRGVSAPWSLSRSRVPTPFIFLFIFSHLTEHLGPPNLFGPHSWEGGEDGRSITYSNGNIHESQATYRHVKKPTRSGGCAHPCATTPYRSQAVSRSISHSRVNYKQDQQQRNTGTLSTQRTEGYSLSTPPPSPENSNAPHI